jgi:hypothetical protein
MKICPLKASLPSNFKKSIIISINLNLIVELFYSLLLGTLKASINQLIKEQLNFQMVSTPHWNPDESSFLASLVFEFILSMKKWNDPGIEPFFKKEIG